MDEIKVEVMTNGYKVTTSNKDVFVFNDKKQLLDFLKEHLCHDKK